MWIVIDTTTNRIVDFHINQSYAAKRRNDYTSLSGNKTVIRLLKAGWKVDDY